MKKVIVIYSGGMDSFTLLNHCARNKEFEIHAVSFDYGQKHDKELDYAYNVCSDLDITNETILLDDITFRGSSLTDGADIPEGHYEDETMRSTFVPNRNMVMLSMAIAKAVSIGANEILYGAHAGDHAIYPDCRIEFVHAMNKVASIANYTPVVINAPYIGLTKAKILKIGLSLGLDYSKTWTCYNGRDKACGKCGSCQERLEAFKLCNAVDPLEYEDA